MKLSVSCAQPDVNMFSIMFVHLYDFHPNVSILHIIVFACRGTLITPRLFPLFANTYHLQSCMMCILV